MKVFFSGSWRLWILAVWISLHPLFSWAQQVIDLTRLEAYATPTANWRPASDVNVNPFQQGDFRPVAGAGLLVNAPDSRNNQDLVSRQEFGDFDLELSFMMAPGSNSGIYLQGLYEIQLRDSWGVARPTFGDCGGVYQRWDQSMPEGQQGYEGIAPALNACKAPGLWQTLFISFSAPRFDLQGKKVRNARVHSVVLNGVEVISGADLSGPTRGALFESERLRGPIRLQGDHGAVAFRNIRLTPYDEAPPAFSSLKYEVFDLSEAEQPQLEGVTPAATGSAAEINWQVSQYSDKFALRFTGALPLSKPGAYTFEVPCQGLVWLSVDGKPLLSDKWWGGTATVELEAGVRTIELTYLKWEPWFSPALGLTVAGPGFRRYALHTQSSLAMSRPVSPIFLKAQSAEPYLFRCFIDYTHEKVARRIVHALSALDPSGVNYTIDLDHGGIVQVWKGEFMDATPMWHDRGDGSAKPLGPVVTLGDQGQVSAPGDLEYKGYFLDAAGYPEFRYLIGGLTLADRPRPLPDRKGIERTLTWENGPQAARFFLATSDAVRALGNGLYLIGDHAFYLQAPETKKRTASIETGEQPGLTWSLQGAGSLRYTLLW